MRLISILGLCVILYACAGAGQIGPFRASCFPPDNDTTPTVSVLLVGLPVSSGSDVKGLDTGVIGRANTVKGVSFHLLTSMSEYETTGVAVSLIGSAPYGDMDGVVLSPYGAGSRSDLRGMAASVFTSVDGSADGLLLGGLVAAAQGDIRGAAVSLIQTGSSEGFTSGVLMGGLHTQSGGGLKGLQLAALTADVDAGDMTGLLLAGGANRVGGDVTGAQLSSLWSRADGVCTGFQFGLFNECYEIRGLQFGLLNRASNGILPWFPLFNFPAPWGGSRPDVTPGPALESERKTSLKSPSL